MKLTIVLELGAGEMQALARCAAQQGLDISTWVHRQAFTAAYSQLGIVNVIVNAGPTVAYPSTPMGFG